MSNKTIIQNENFEIIASGVYLKTFAEPLLTFGFNQKMIDARDGLTFFGAFMKTNSSNIGIIGTKVGCRRMTNWLIELQSPVLKPENDIARPYFPGFESVFNLSININTIKTIQIEKSELDKYLKYEDPHQRVFNLVNLYCQRLIEYTNKEEYPINVWLVVIPDEIYAFGRPNSNIPKSEENIKVGMKKKYQNLPSLFDADKKLQEAYKYEVHFHNQLKAKLLKNQIVTQIIREETIAYKEILTDIDKIKYEEKFDSAKAWNISTTLFYKLGGIPWKLGEVREGVCYLGLVYKKIESEDIKNACCAAQMFLESGDGQVFRGNVGPWFNPKKGDFHLKREAAFDLLNKAVETFKQKNDKLPKEIFIHAKTFFNDEEWQGFQEAVGDKIKIIGVRIRNDNTFKLYREFKYAVPRCTALILNPQKAYLWTKGFIPRIQNQLGKETPNPLLVEITKGQENIETVCQDILALTKLNYNACIFADGLPVTLRFADSIGEILTAGPLEQTDVLPFKHYI